MRYLPGALRSHGIVERLSAVDAGSVDPPDYVADVEPMGVRNRLAIRNYSLRLAGRVERMIRDGVRLGALPRIGRRPRCGGRRRPGAAVR